MPEENKNQVQTYDQQNKSPVEKTLKLNETQVLDLSSLSDGQISELKSQHARGMVELKNKAEDLKIQVGALDATLSSFNDQTSKATQSGSSATISFTQTTTLGRTEVIIGNTDKAATGKLSRSATGEKDKTIWIIGIIAAAAVLVALFLGKH